MKFYYGLIFLTVCDFIFLLVVLDPWVFDTPSNGVFERAKFWRVLAYLASMGTIALKVSVYLLIRKIMIFRIFNKINDVDAYQSLDDVENEI